MSNRSRSKESTEADTRKQTLVRELFDEIREEAYFQWQRRGSPHGEELTDWFCAEDKVLAAAGFR